MSFWSCLRWTKRVPAFRKSRIFPWRRQNHCTCLMVHIMHPALPGLKTRLIVHVIYPRLPQPIKMKNMVMHWLTVVKVLFLSTEFWFKPFTPPAIAWPEHSGAGEWLTFNETWNLKTKSVYVGFHILFWAFVLGTSLQNTKRILQCRARCCPKTTNRKTKQTFTNKAKVNKIKLNLYNNRCPVVVFK